MAYLELQIFGKVFRAEFADQASDDSEPDEDEDTVVDADSEASRPPVGFAPWDPESREMDCGT